MKKASPNVHGLLRWDNKKNINHTEMRKEPNKSQNLKVMLRIKDGLVWVQYTVI